MLVASFDSVAGGLGVLAVAGSFVAALFVFWKHLGRRTVESSPQFPAFALIVAIAASFSISLMLQNWWFFAVALLALPALRGSRWAGSKVLARRACHV